MEAAVVGNEFRPEGSPIQGGYQHPPVAGNNPGYAPSWQPMNQGYPQFNPAAPHQNYGMPGAGPMPPRSKAPLVVGLIVVALVVVGVAATGIWWFTKDSGSGSGESATRNALPAALRQASTCEPSREGSEKGRLTCTIPAGNSLIDGLFAEFNGDESFDAWVDTDTAKQLPNKTGDQLVKSGSVLAYVDTENKYELYYGNADSGLTIDMSFYGSKDNAMTFLRRAGLITGS
ncbi:hypothetical protein VMT65_03285 [Nocardia sp. CDC153]|nr:hypothetical protein [Nocardia sp. CDC153]